MNWNLKILLSFLANLVVSIVVAQGDMSAPEQLSFGISSGDSKMIEKSILRGAIISRDHLIQAINIVNFPDNKSEQRNQALQLIISKCTQFSGRGSDSETPLTALAKSHNLNQKSESPVAIAQTIIKKGANINEPNKEGRTALNILCDADIFMDINHRVNFARLLLDNKANKEFQSNQQMTSGGTPLLNAAANGYFDLVKLLLEKGANPNARNESSEGALEKILKSSQNEVSNEEKKAMIQLLISHGANPKMKNENGESPLDIAKNENLLALFTPDKNPSRTIENKKQELIDVPGYGEVNANKALNIFLFLGDVVGVKKAIKAGADVNMIQDEGGQYGKISALTKAASPLCRKNNLEIVQLLLNEGVKANNKENSSALYASTQYAASIHELAFKEKLGTYQFSGNEKATSSQKYEEFTTIIKLLIEKGVKVDGDIAYGSGETSLMAAVKGGDLSLVTILLQYGANVKIKSSDGFPLMNGAAGGLHTWAVAAGSMALKGKQSMGIPIENVSQLEGEMDDIKKKQAKWIDLFSEYTAIVKLLIAKGANVNVNYKSITPLQQAQAYHITPMIQALKAAGAR